MVFSYVLSNTRVCACASAVCVCMCVCFTFYHFGEPNLKFLCWCCLQPFSITQAHLTPCKDLLQLLQKFLWYIIKNIWPCDMRLMCPAPYYSCNDGKGKIMVLNSNETNLSGYMANIEQLSQCGDLVSYAASQLQTRYFIIIVSAYVFRTNF